MDDQRISTAFKVGRLGFSFNHMAQTIENYSAHL
jgi:hypothetical protein